MKRKLITFLLCQIMTLKKTPGTRMGLLCFAALAGFIPESSQAQTVTSTPTNEPAQVMASSVAEEFIVLPTGLNDPIEPFNRAMWGFNQGFLTWVVKPPSRIYRRVVFKPVRTGIGNMGKNLTFPGKFLNNMLQAKWAAMGQETERCLCNTAIGVGGFFDVATRWGIPRSDASFGQTFSKWGCKPGYYLMLPVFGPSDVRDGTGLLGDAAANPMTYFFPFMWIGSGVRANDLTDSAEGSVRFIQAEPDSYSLLQYGWSFGHQNRKADMRVTGDQDKASLETLQSALFTYQDAEFPARGKTRSVLIPTTGKKLEFTFWLQPRHAPVVYLVPGFGAHRLAGNELGLAELLYKNGFSAVTLSSTYHREFMEQASTSDLPSYPPADVNDLHVALTAIDRCLEAQYRDRLGSRALMGYSMGGFQSLFLAAQAATNQAPLIKFERYVAIDSPIDLGYAVTNLDRFYREPLAWPPEERSTNIENMFLKVVALSEQSPQPGAVLPFNAIESKFLISMGLHLTLRDIIFSSQLRHNQGVLNHPLEKSRRRAAYEEIMQYSFSDYIDKFVTPYDKTKNIDLADPVILRNATNLRAYTAELQANANIRFIANRNDFLLAAEDLAWIEATFAHAHVILFKHGGHLGNLSQPLVQQAMVEALGGLGACPSHQP